MTSRLSNRSVLLPSALKEEESFLCSTLECSLPPAPSRELSPSVLHLQPLFRPLCGPPSILSGRPQAGDTIYSAGAMDRNFFLINQGEVALEVEGCASKRCQR